jgi:predicted membrane-bound dolichyl-phosphate-mannose-protein mannosyltransferase
MPVSSDIQILANSYLREADILTVVVTGLWLTQNSVRVVEAPLRAQFGYHAWVNRNPTCDELLQ